MSNPLEDPREMKVLHKMLNSFFHYRSQAHYHFTHKRRQSFYAMPQKHWSMLAAPPFHLLETLDKVDDAIDQNAEISEAFLKTGLGFAGIDSAPVQENSSWTSVNDISTTPAWKSTPNPQEQEKAHATLRQLYRDWSAEGKAERDACYGPIIRALDVEFGDVPYAQKGNIQVLVPGAGLGRSLYEIVRSGYSAEGNEISYHQIVGSFHMLNCTEQVGQYTLYPWAHDFSNHITRSDQLQRVLIPDVHPGTELDKASEDTHIHAFERISFSSADFCVAYNKPLSSDVYDAVATIFFIDTAPNIIRYVETVHSCLKEGGIWINLGPLKWHFENSPPGEKDKSEDAVDIETTDDAGIAEPGSVELTNEEVVMLVEKCGFMVEQQQIMTIETEYIGNPNSMWKGTYRPSFWVARKVSQ
ncbi:N2227-domain-containing protein [Tothia fuscella]|uniref:carnosine N-methyltransferase n=1 Tax=Tothia fuscella TaxID=1048955 RepID=A0A9P4NTU0_9PEZI|nr:N2227-domain-containing protein [Tothia fuscella]